MLALEKLLASFLSLPGLFIVLWLIVTVYLLARGRSFFIKLVAGVTLVLMYITFSALGVLIFLYPLETAYPIENYQINHPVVVLGGGLNYYPGDEGQAELNASTLSRLVAGYRLYTNVGGPVIVTGGVGVGHQGSSEAEIAADWLKTMGVPGSDIVRETEARTTYENGLYVKKWLEKNGYQGSNDYRARIYLVTSAVHLPRSMMVFKEQDIEPIPIPAGYLYSHRLSWLDYLPNRGAVYANLAAIHEWLGLVWYRINNRI